MKTVIEMAKEAGFTDGELSFMTTMFERFAELVRADSQRTWVGLTEDEVTLCHSLAVLSKKHDGTDPSFTTLLHQQIETKLQEKNT